NFIARRENISYSDAMNLIRRFVEHCNKEMDAERKIRFRGIGLIYKDENGKTQFDQDLSTNYLPDAFGLSTFNAPTIYRQEGRRRFEHTIKDSPQISLRSRAWVKGLKWAAVIVPLLAIGTWTLLNKNMLQQKYDQYAIYFSPITGDKELDEKTFTQQELEQQIREKKQKLNNFEINQSSFVPGNSDNSTGKKAVIADESEGNTDKFVKPTTKEKPVSKDERQQSNDLSASWKYQIITGSFLDESNAHDHLRQLESLGFRPEMAGKNSYGYYRVAATGSDNRREAISRLNLIKQEDYNDAWLLVR
ncbi:MAG TPA: hypothetical protein VJ939_01320, partial [Bacteroidales bacterium]|nr:hypothetical protein [Bacteroidales bacterium]